MPHPGEDLPLLEDALWLWVAPTGQGVYDFLFDRFFACRRPYAPPERRVAVARAGAWSDSAGRYRELEAEGIHLVHTPEQHLVASELPHWYPRLEGLTPRSLWFETPPEAERVGRELGREFHPLRRAALVPAREAAARLGVPFLVVDVAQETSGRWLIIECNDGQESSYAGISPFTLWSNILEVERKKEPLSAVDAER